MVLAHEAQFTADLSECSPVDGNCVHSPDSVAWSPHNVLFVATGWALYLHVNSLVAADAIIRPIYQRSSDVSSHTCIAGAKWALDLVPEDAYPAACRLCVRTTRDLFVYRVLRCGMGGLRVSAGVCLSPRHPSTEDSNHAKSPNGNRTKRTRAARTAEDNDKGSDTVNENAVAVVATGAAGDGKDQVPVSDTARWCLICYEWFPQDLLVTVTFGGIYLINMHGDAEDESTLQYRLFSSPAYRFSKSPLATLRPACATRVVGCDAEDAQLVVASPCWLHLFSVSAAHVHLTHCVEIYALRSIPVSLCCMRDNAADETVRIFISAPVSILQGTVMIPVSCKKNVPAELKSVEWTLTDSWGPETDLGDEITVRRFLTIPFHTFAPSLAEKTCIGTSVGNSPPILVLGLCHRRLLGFVGRNCVNLIRCAQFDGIAVRRNVVLGISGVAIHPSCTLAVLGLRFGSRNYPPFQLLPVPVNDEDGFLSRLIQFQDGFFTPSECEQLKGREAERGADTSLVSDSTLITLWNRQTTTSHFVWEGLLPKNTICAALLQRLHSYYDHQKQRGGVGTVALPASEAAQAREGSENIDVSAMGVTGVIRKLRQRYLEFRQEHGIELFLRFPENGAEWRQTLIRILRRSLDNSTTMELLLANAVQLMAGEVRYAGFTWKDRASIVALNAGIATCSSQFAAAVQFGRLYHEQCVKEDVWIHSAGFAERLLTFIDVVTARWGEPHPNVEKLQAQSPITSQFPCSVCGGENLKRLTLSLSTTLDSPRPGPGVARDDCSNGMHFTVFSGSTFTPLSFLAQDEVVSRCHTCKMYDYVTGPLCRVCDGLVL